MSFFPDMSVEQIAALDETAIAEVVNRYCAEQGIAIFLEAIGEKPVPTVEPDRTYFKVCGWMFDTQEKARAVADAARERFKQGYSYKHYRNLPTAEIDSEDIEIEPIKLFSPEQYAKHLADITAHDSRTNAWEERKKAVDEASNKKADVYHRVYQEWSKATDAVSEVARLDRLFDKYVDLAKGDRDMALTFLRKAEKLDEAWHPTTYDPNETKVMEAVAT